MKGMTIPGTGKPPAKDLYSDGQLVSFHVAIDRADQLSAVMRIPHGDLKSRDNCLSL